MNDRGAEDYLAFREGGTGADTHFENLVYGYRDALVLFISQYIRNIDDAEDVAQEVFFRLYVKRPRYSPRASFRTWLFTIGKNEALNFLKKHKNEADPDTELPDEGGPAPADELIADEKRRALHAALGELNETYRVVLYLQYFEELGNDQIAAVTGKSPKAVRDALCNAKKSLRAIILNGGKKYEILQTDD